MKRKEPEQLWRGKEFHKKIQSEWIREAEGEITVEKRIIKPTGRAGRIDVFALAGGDEVAVLEIKVSDWDAMTPRAVNRNIRRQIRQIWHYIDSQLTEGKTVSTGITFPKRPRDKQRMELIERLFEEEGIPVVWDDETIHERKNRGSESEDEEEISGEERRSR